MRYSASVKCLSRWALVLASIVLFGAVTLMAAKKDKDKKAAPEESKPAATDQSQYVGSDTCKACHEEQWKNIEASPHFRLKAAKIRGEAAHGCESCHGPGAAHVEGGGDKTKIFSFKGASTDAISRRCLSCHEANQEQRQFLRSTHHDNQVGCTTCHSVHHSTREYQLVKKQPGLCFDCHSDIKGDFQKPFRHRVEEGLINCSDCHNPHGTFNERQLRATADQNFACFKCHTDKRGPFVYEHEPVKVEGCTYCHTPHGSTNPRLLKTARVNSLCLQCHTNMGNPTGTPGASVHPQNTYRQSCIICHSNIHGSNTSNLLFKP
ncbi:MAG: DmsE family decaheme c-type cytochrome [Candidatus Korobacteraceae bacterium]